MRFLSISQTSEKWRISGRRIQRLCAEGRIPGAIKIGSYWAIPENAEKPRDERIRSGRYVKQDRIVCNKTVVIRDEYTTSLE